MEYCKFRNFCEGFIFAKLRGNETFSKMEKSPQLIYSGKSCTSYTFLASQICLSILFVKIEFSRKILNLQYTTFDLIIPHAPITLCILLIIFTLRASDFMSI